MASDSSGTDHQGEEVVVPLPTISPSHVDAVIHHDYAARESPRSLKRKLGDANEMLAFARKKFYVANNVTKRLKKQIKDLNQQLTSGGAFFLPAPLVFLRCFRKLRTDHR